MPASKKYIKGTKKVLYKKPKKVSKKRLTVGTYITNKQAFPDKMHTILTTEMDGYIALGLNRSSYLIAIMANNIYLPAALITNAPAASAVEQFVTQQANGTSFATLQPSGYTQIASIYKRYRVKYCKIDVCILPQTLGDSIFYAVAPCTQLQQVAQAYAGTSGAVVPSASTLAKVPRSKSALVQSQGGRPQHLRMGYSTAVINGITRQQYEYAIPSYVAIGANPSTAVGSQLDNDMPWWYMISINDADNANFAANVNIQIKLTQYVELVQDQQGFQ